MKKFIHSLPIYLDHRKRLLAATILLSTWLLPVLATADDSLIALLDRGVQHQLRGDYEKSSEVARVIKSRYPNSATGNAFEMNTLVTRLSWDVDDTQFDEALEAEAKQALTLCKKQIRDQPDEAAGYHLCGQANFALTFLYAARGSYYRAGRNSSRTIDHLEAALERDPGLDDAKMHLGATYYYADNLPPFIKAISRFLWFIPTGNSDKALPYMKQAAENGQHLGDAAKFIYADLVMSNESSQPHLLQEAQHYLETLVTRYPTNRRFQLKYLQFLGQTKQFDDLLLAADAFVTRAPCCPIAVVDAELAHLWKTIAHRELENITAAKAEFATVTKADFPSWGHQWYDTIATSLEANQ